MTVSKLKNRPVCRRNKLANLKKHNVLKGNPQSIVHIEWLSEIRKLTRAVGGKFKQVRF